MKAVKRNLLIGLLSTTMGSHLAYAQSATQVENTDPINIDGYVKPQVEVTDGELEQIRSELNNQKNQTELNKKKSKGYRKLVRQTEKLADSTEQYLEEKNEAKESIAQYNKRIKCLMEQNANDPECQDKVSTKSSAVQKSQAQVQPERDSLIKIIPAWGFQNYSGDGIEQLNSEVAINLSVESEISNRFSVGLGVNYETLTTRDFNPSLGFGMGAFNPAFNPGVFNPYQNTLGAFNQRREVEFSRFSLEGYSKFYITKTKRFKPFVQGSFGYNRATLNYNENYQFQGAFTNPFGFGQEEYTTNFLTASVSGGTEVMVTDTIGAQLSVGYLKGFNEFGNSQSVDSIFNFDQQRLRELGTTIAEADILRVYLGMIIGF